MLTLAQSKMLNETIPPLMLISQSLNIAKPSHVVNNKEIVQSNFLVSECVSWLFKLLESGNGKVSNTQTSRS